MIWSDSSVVSSRINHWNIMQGALEELYSRFSKPCLKWTLLHPKS